MSVANAAVDRYNGEIHMTGAIADDEDSASNLSAVARSVVTDA